MPPPKQALGMLSSGRGTRRVSEMLCVGGAIGVRPDPKLICVEGEGISQAIVVLLPGRGEGK